MPNWLPASLRPLLVVAALLSASGCDPGHDHGPGADHGHAHDGGHGHGHGDEKTDAITVFSERHELFIEHPFLVKGKPATFVTHVTDVVAMEPRTEGPITFVLQKGDAPPIEQEVPAVARAGIYLPDVTFPEAGEWRVAIRIPSADGADLVELPSRTVYATQHDADHADPSDGGPAEADGISFLKEQQWKLRFQTTPVVRRTLVERLHAPARLTAPPALRAEVHAPLAGRLLAPEGGALPTLGQQVEAGQVLARVQPLLAGADQLAFLSGRQQLAALRIELEAKVAAAASEAARAQVALERTELQLARVRELAGRQAKSQREVETAEFEHKSAQADLEAARIRQRLFADVVERLGELPADLSRGFPAVDLVAPIAGTLTHAAGAHGERVTSETPLFTVLDRSRLHLEVRVPEVDVERLPATPDVVFTTPGDRHTYRPVLDPSQGKAGGRLLLRPSQVDPHTRAARLVYELPNPGDLLAGLAVEAYVATREARDVLAIPESALVEEEGRPVAFVLLGGELFEKRDLVLGARDAGWVEVRSGLAEGERVVSIGAYAVKLASVGTALPSHGHAH